MEAMEKSVHPHAEEWKQLKSVSTQTLKNKSLRKFTWR